MTFEQHNIHLEKDYTRKRILISLLFYKNYFLLKCLIIFFGLISPVNAQESEQQFAFIGDFQLENGEVIKDCRIGYRTFGILNQDKSNVIIFPSWFAGSSKSLSNLIGPGKFVDDTRFFIIAIDALGNGVSSSPSNSEQQPGIKFPQFNIRDLVHSQYRLVTEVFGFNHLFGIIGGSMGGMQALQWLVSYPDFMDRVLPYVPTPKLTSYELLLMNFQAELIESGWKSGMSERDIMKSLQIITALTAHTPQYLAKEIATENFPEYYSKFDREPSAIFTVANWRAQMRAMIAQDIFFKFKGSMTIAAHAVKAKVLIIAAVSDHILTPGPVLEFAKLINAEVLLLESDCGHLSISCQMEKCKEAVHKFFGMD